MGPGWIQALVKAPEGVELGGEVSPCKAEKKLFKMANAFSP